MHFTSRSFSPDALAKTPYLKTPTARVAKKYGFQKPNDLRALNLMNAAAKAIMKEIPDIKIAYGVSDEFSFVFDRACNLFQRRKE